MWVVAVALFHVFVAYKTSKRYNQRIKCWCIRGVMQEFIEKFAEQNHIDIIRVVDIASLTLEENRGYSYAILLAKVLPKEYIDKLNREMETDYTVFLDYEHKTDELADKLALVIQENGYRAISQSENGIHFRGEYDERTKSSVLPHKKIATMSGLGWIGKNNLLITEKYGAAFSMCSVLTDMPLNTAKAEIISSRCGECNLCVNFCPVHAILGREWKLGISREEIVDVHQCITCLKCLAGCRYSIMYLNS